MSYKPKGLALNDSRGLYVTDQSCNLHKRMSFIKIMVDFGSSLKSVTSILNQDCSKVHSFHVKVISKGVSSTHFCFYPIIHFVIISFLHLKTISKGVCSAHFKFFSIIHLVKILHTSNLIYMYTDQS